MKTLKTLFCLLLCLTSAAAFAQKSDQAKPTLFTAYPETIQLSKNILHNTMNSSEGEQVIVAFTNEFRFKGTVISNRKKYDNLQSVMIKSAAFGNSIFQLSRITNPDKSFSYTGRIINPDALDGYEIKKDVNNNYSFTKFETKKILQDCSFK
jgi:hypothetical protein